MKFTPWSLLYFLVNEPSAANSPSNFAWPTVNSLGASHFTTGQATRSYFCNSEASTNLNSFLVLACLNKCFGVSLLPVEEITSNLNIGCSFVKDNDKLFLIETSRIFPLCSVINVFNTFFLLPL